MFYRNIFLQCSSLLVLLLLCGCSLTSLPRQEEDTVLAHKAWHNYLARAKSADMNAGPFRIRANIRYTNKTESNRVAALLWGNGSLTTPHPLRLDLIAGVGNIVAKIYEDPQTFLVYAPDENTAYVSMNQTHEANMLLSYGVPIPFSLSDLALLLTGRGGVLFLADDATRSSMPNDFSVDQFHNTTFYIPNSYLPGHLTISSNGLPTAWSELMENGWHVTFESSNSNQLLPRKLRITHPDGYDATILVKEIEHLSRPYSAEQLSLVLPDKTKLIPLLDQTN